LGVAPILHQQLQRKLSMLAFFNNIVQYLHKQNIPYMLSGSVALGIYTLPRTTRDFDFIVHFQSKDADALVEHFKEGFYCDADAVKEAISRRGMFNIIDYVSGYKADFVMLKNEPFRQTEFNRRRQADFYGTPIYVVSPEDLLLSKLLWIQELQSNIQKDDIKNLCQINSLEWEYINFWVSRLKINTFGLLPQ
jgi:hypothetical protein